MGLEPERWDLIIIGGGIAGLSVALWARRLELSALVLEQAEEPGGQLRHIAQPIVDYPGLTGVTGAELSRQLRRQAEGAGAVVRSGVSVVRLDAAARCIETATGNLSAGALVLATGLTPRQLGVPGEAELRRHRPSTEPDWFRGKRVVVIGGGDRAAENALLLAPVAAKVALIHRGEQLRARQTFQEQLQATANVTLHLGREVTGFSQTDGAIHCHMSSGDLTADAVCIYIGNRPNSDLVAGQAEMNPEGYVVTDRNGQSTAQGLYAVGDVCTAAAYQSLSTAAGQAMVVAKHVALQRGEA